jgi:hypothetical protein
LYIRTYALNDTRSRFVLQIAYWLALGLGAIYSNNHVISVKNSHSIEK